MQSLTINFTGFMDNPDAPVPDWSIDFSEQENVRLPNKAEDNPGFTLHEGAEIRDCPHDVPKALRIDSDGPWASLDGLDISPSKMKDCTRK